MADDNINIIYIDTGERRDKTYLTDGVYVDHDDMQMWLSAERDGKLHEIAVDHNVLNALLNYARRLGYFGT
jgi:hypothetical protein